VNPAPLPEIHRPAASGKPISLSMLGWALNEEANITAYVHRAEAFLRPLCQDFELVVIDDGSTDKTAEILADLQTDRPWLKVFRNERNRGSGFNTKRAISVATKDYLFWQMVDWSYDLTMLPEALPSLADVDILQGVRAGRVGRIWNRSDTTYKGLISWVNYTLVRRLFNMPIHDFQNVTVYPTALIQSITVESESAFTNPELLIKTWWRGASILEFPVTFLARQKGVAKGTRVPVILRSIRDILRWWFKWRVVQGQPQHDPGSINYWDVWQRRKARRPGGS
jgi:glycosyltransferase involved in cell wall biosynthesis